MSTKDSTRCIPAPRPLASTRSLAGVTLMRGAYRLQSSEQKCACFPRGQLKGNTGNPLPLMPGIEYTGNELGDLLDVIGMRYAPTSRAHRMPNCTWIARTWQNSPAGQPCQKAVASDPDEQDRGTNHKHHSAFSC
jgi:hypothetical protein